jgi:Tfp pilus assembly protein FimT
MTPWTLEIESLKKKNCVAFHQSLVAFSSTHRRALQKSQKKYDPKQQNISSNHLQYYTGPRTRQSDIWTGLQRGKFRPNQSSTHFK